MTKFKYDIIEEDMDAANFDSFIERQEQLKVGWDDGFFKVIVAPGKPRAQSPESIIKTVTTELKSLHRQDVYGGYGTGNIYYFLAETARQHKEAFKRKAMCLSSYSEPTCCSETLHLEGIESLIKHYYKNLKQGAYQTQCSEKEKLNLCLKTATKLKATYNAKKKANSFFKCASKWKYNTVCSCKDCTVTRTVVESSSETQNVKHEASETLDEEALLYGAGISMKTPRTQLRITKSFTLGKLVNILLLDSNDQYEGISCPYSYLGYLHTFFPIHIEDSSLWSINYLHVGHPKIWFIIPPKAYLLLLFYLWRSGLPLNQTSCWNILAHKCTIVTPQWLDERHIPYKVAVQNAGEAMILYPNTPHFGFNAGWNIAEAINFATKSWIVDGLSSPKCLCMKQQVHINMTNYIAAFREDLLETFLTGGYIPMQRESEMAEMFHQALKTPVQMPTYSTKNGVHVLQPEQQQGKPSDDCFGRIHPTTLENLYQQALSLPNTEECSVASYQPQQDPHCNTHCPETGLQFETPISHCSKHEHTKTTVKKRKHQMDCDELRKKKPSKVVLCLNCPVDDCVQQVPLSRKERMANHIYKRHKPLVEKYELISRLNEQVQELKKKSEQSEDKSVSRKPLGM